MRSGVAQALRPRVWHDCALFFFDLGISYFTGFGTRLGRILAVQNQINPLYRDDRVQTKVFWANFEGSYLNEFGSVGPLRWRVVQLPLNNT